MTKLIYFSTLLFFLAAGQMINAQSSQHVDLLARWDPAGIPGQYNDCWGYTAPNGKEYAIVGSNQHIHIFDFSDVDNITEIHRITPGGTSSWRDFKTYGEYAYGVTDSNGGDEGLVIMELTDIDNSIDVTYSDTAFHDAHNIFVDSVHAKMYVVGSNTVSQGLIIFDLTDPKYPEVIAEPLLSGVTDGPSNGYVHDIFVRDDTAYCSHGYSGYFVWDVASPSSPILLGGINPVGSGYNHSSWLTTDSRYAYWAEEVPAGRPIHVADLQDLDAIDVVHTFSDPLIADKPGVRPHNPFVKDDILYISYYQDGVQIYDISDPELPRRIGYYDTSPGDTSYSGYNNNWGTYPYFTDNKMVASDRDSGVFFLQFDQTAALLPVELISWEGEIKNEAAVLSWKTAQEINSDYYEIEHRNGNGEFKSLGAVEARKNTFEISSYSFTHSKLNNGKNYYRLKMVDQDGSYTFSNIIDLNNLLEDNSWFIYPNPSNGLIQVDLPNTDSDLSEALYTFYDIQGKACLQGNALAADQNTLQIINELSAGMYTLEIRLSDGQYHRDQIAVY